MGNRPANSLRPASRATLHTPVSPGLLPVPVGASLSRLWSFQVGTSGMAAATAPVRMQVRLSPGQAGCAVTSRLPASVPCGHLFLGVVREGPSGTVVALPHRSPFFRLHGWARCSRAWPVPSQAPVLEFAPNGRRSRRQRRRTASFGRAARVAVCSRSSAVPLRGRTQRPQTALAAVVARVWSGYAPLTRWQGRARSGSAGVSRHVGSSGSSPHLALQPAFGRYGA